LLKGIQRDKKLSIQTCKDIQRKVHHAWKVKTSKTKEKLRKLKICPYIFETKVKQIQIKKSQNSRNQNGTIPL
jgi:hypothetical protein